MSDEINKDILVALKALLWVRDNPHRLTYGITTPVEDFARQVIERVEFRPQNTSVKLNGVPEGWYDDVKEKRAVHPLALMAAVCENHGKHGVFDGYGIEPADLEAYFEQTALAETGPSPDRPVQPQP
jgi:hypothetical protein